MSWAGRRKGLYLGAVFFVCALLILWAVYAFFSRAPTCSDGIMNGSETGVDCGGACERLCATDTREPVLLWSRSFPLTPGTYTAAAYLENPNIGAGSRVARYSFRLYDANNILVAERRGETFIPPQRYIPIVETGILTGNRIPVRTILEFTEDIVWDVIPSARVSVSNEVLEPARGRLAARLTNTSGEDISNLVVAAVLFDEDGVARAASKSVISSLPRRGSEEVVFTWPSALSSIARIEITPLSP